uniref:Col_cuticle_N domain-containing protein n=1 Tax=Heterorhabditis bacteriophora TaxID=37862 RepID=A0A1I7W8S8_HETBA
MFIYFEDQSAKLMRLPELLSAVTLNMVLALFSMLMAIIALGLLAFVLAKDNYMQKETAKLHPREKIKRHESYVVDFKNPSSIPEHFLQLNTLMFQKKPKNNQIVSMSVPISVSGMALMTPLDDEKYANKELPPIPIEEEDLNSNSVSPVRLTQRSVTVVSINSETPSSFITDSGISDEDYSSDATSIESTDIEREKKKESSSKTVKSASWIEEEKTIEPYAEKIIVNLECGSEVSLC